MFNGCSKFNQDVSLGVVSIVEDMSNMFKGCAIFNQNVSLWNVSNVKNMTSMFESCEKFNQDVSLWVVSNVTNMSYMFKGCVVFNNGATVGSTVKQLTWTLSTIKNMVSMVSMFEGCGEFNQKIKNKGNNNWTLSSVTEAAMMQDMFKDCVNYDQDIQHWKFKASFLTGGGSIDMFKDATAMNNDKYTPSAPCEFIDIKDGSAKIKAIIIDGVLQQLKTCKIVYRNLQIDYDDKLKRKEVYADIPSTTGIAVLGNNTYINNSNKVEYSCNGEYSLLEISVDGAVNRISGAPTPDIHTELCYDSKDITLDPKYKCVPYANIGGLQSDVGNNLIRTPQMSHNDNTYKINGKTEGGWIVDGKHNHSDDLTRLYEGDYITVKCKSTHALFLDNGNRRYNDPTNKWVNDINYKDEIRLEYDPDPNNQKKIKFNSVGDDNKIRNNVKLSPYDSANIQCKKIYLENKIPKIATPNDNTQSLGTYEKSIILP